MLRLGSVLLGLLFLAFAPAALLAQLRENGRMIIPVGMDDSQQLQFIRMVNGRPVTSLRELVRFVPLVHDARD